MIWECTQDAFNASVKAAFCEDKEKQVSIGRIHCMPLKGS